MITSTQKKYWQAMEIKLRSASIKTCDVMFKNSVCVLLLLHS